MKVHNLVVTGSLTSGGENISTISSSVASTVTNVSSSVSASISQLSSSMLTTMTNLSSSMVSVMATTGSNTFVGNQNFQGSLIPFTNGTYDLGSPTNEFRHLYLSSASLYIDGTKVLGSTTQELQITTDAGQSFKILEAGSDTITLQAADGNITLAASGGGDVILDPTTGIIALKGTTTIYAGNRILSSDGNAIHFGNSVTMTGSLIVTGFIETQELRTTYISSSILYRSGSTKFGDELTDTHAFSGSVLISGSISVPGSNLVSGSAQILNGSGIWSGSAQLPSGVVSGSVQVDVLSTTNIERLATTGSNTFTANQIITNGGRPYFIANTTNSGEEAGIKIQQSTVSDWYIGTAQGTSTAQDIAIRDVKNGRIPFYISSANGSSTFFSIDSSGARTTPFTAMTLIADNSSNPYDGFGTALLFQNRIYSGGPTPGGIQNGGRIRTSLKNNSSVNYGTDLLFDVTTTGNGALTTTLTLSYDYGSKFHTNLGIGVNPLTKLHLQGSSPNYILLTNTAADGVQNAIQGGIIGQSRGYSNNLSQMASILFRNENSAAWYKGEITFSTNGSDGTDPNVSPTERLRISSGGNIGVNEVSPSKKLTVNFGTSISDGLLVTGSQRQETRFKSSGEHSNVFIDSAHSNIYLPTLGLQRSSTTYGEIKLQRASNSDSLGSFTESEMIIGSTTTVPVSIKTNEVRRVVIESGGNVNVYNALTVSNNIQARNFNKYVRSWSTNGSYIWYEQLDAISGAFDDAGLYRGFLRSSNGAHYNGYYFDILVGSKGYGGLSSQYRVQNVTSAMSPYVGGCGGSPISAIDNTGFTKVQNPCYESLELYITRLG